MVYKPPFLLPFDSDVQAPPAYSVVHSKGQNGSDGGSGGRNVANIFVNSPDPSAVQVDGLSRPLTVNVINTGLPPPPVEFVAVIEGGSAVGVSNGDGVPQGLFDQNASEINRFISNQRQQYQLGVGTYQKNRVALDGLDVAYTNNLGRESIQYRVQDKQGGPVSVIAGTPGDFIAVEFFDGAT